MSQVSVSFDNLLARVQAALGAGWTQLPNAYAIEQNPELMMAKGYGVALGAGSNTRRTLSGLLSLTRQMTLTLVREVAATEMDVSTTETLAKTLLEDLHLVVKDLEGNATLNSGEINASYDSDNGVQFLATGTGNFMFVQATFAVEFSERT